MAHHRLVHLTKLLPPHELDDHRAKVGLRLEVLVHKTSKFGWDRIDSGVRTTLRKDWMDALQDFTLEEIDAACRAAILANPDKCPNEGHIKSLIIKERAELRASLPKPPEPERFVATSIPLEERRAFAEQVLGRFRMGK